MPSASQPLWPLCNEQMRRTWALVDILTSLKTHTNHPAPTAKLICCKFRALSMRALDMLSFLVDYSIARKHGGMSPSCLCGMAMAVKSFQEDTASEIAHVQACNNVVSDATVNAASFQTSSILHRGVEHLAMARKSGIPLVPIATDRHAQAMAALAKGKMNMSTARETLGVVDAHIPEDGGFVSSNGLLIGAAYCISVMERLDRPGDICCGTCHQIFSGNELSICRRCGDQLLCKGCLAGEGYAWHLINDCRRVRAKVRGMAQSLTPHLRESVRRVAVVRLNGSGLIVPMHITSLASPLIPSSLSEALSRCSAVVPLLNIAVHWCLLVSFLADMEGDEQEVIDYEHVHHVQAAEYAVEVDTQPSKRGAPKLLPSEKRRLRKDMKAADIRAKEEARAAAEAAAIAEANAVLDRQSARPDATSAMLTSVLLKRGGTASPEVVARTRVKRDSLKAIERDARKPDAKAKREEPDAAERVRIDGDLTNGRLDAALLLQRRARTWLRGRKKLRRKQRSRAAKCIQHSVRNCRLLLRAVAKPHTASTAASSGSEGADGEESELPEAELPKPASTEPTTTECAVCLDGNANYAVVPCGHRCLCANCSKILSQCPVCRTRMTAVLRVFV
jgi:hypothetical protein